ncbi:MAG: AI-2E family transporter [Isosphaeraceae bacterium]
MASRSASGTSRNTALRALAGFATLAFLYLAGEVLKPLSLSVLLAFALTPGARRLERLGLHRSLAVVITVLGVLGLIGGGGWIVAGQLSTLANRLPDYQDNIEHKLGTVIQSRATAASDRLTEMVDHVTARMEKPRPADPDAPVPTPTVRVIPETSFQERLRAWAGPYVEALGIFSFVLVLVLFMMIGREDLRDRIVSLFGHRHVGLTTRTMEEIGDRISRYLVTIVLVNASFGLVIGLGLAAIGVPFAALWGVLAAVLRFIPYVGAAVAFALPTLFAAAHFPGWGQAIGVAAYFGAVETVLSSFLEPWIFGKTTGLSALGLLIAAMFWTWLWGPMGLLLSTPMTVCLAVIGKYVPGLGFFATLLGEDVELEPHLRYFQRIVALDRSGALGIARAQLAEHSRMDVFDRVLLPALARAGRDAGRGLLDETERTFLWDVTGELLDELEAGPEGATAAEKGGTAAKVVGLASDRSDTLALRMVAASLRGSGVALEIPEAGASPLEISEALDDQAPAALLISHLPPESLTTARYLIRRLRAQKPGLPIVLGLWGDGRAAVAAARRIEDVGTLTIVSSITETRSRLLRIAAPADAQRSDVAPLPS